MNSLTKIAGHIQKQVFLSKTASYIKKARPVAEDMLPMNGAVPAIADIFGPWMQNRAGRAHAMAQAAGQSDDETPAIIKHPTTINTLLGVGSALGGGVLGAEIAEQINKTSPRIGGGLKDLRDGRTLAWSGAATGAALGLIATAIGAYAYKRKAMKEISSKFDQASESGKLKHVPTDEGGWRNILLPIGGIHHKGKTDAALYSNDPSREEPGFDTTSNAIGAAAYVAPALGIPGSSLVGGAIEGFRADNSIQKANRDKAKKAFVNKVATFLKKANANPYIFQAGAGGLVGGGLGALAGAIAGEEKDSQGNVVQSRADRVKSWLARGAGVGAGAGLVGGKMLRDAMGSSLRSDAFLNLTARNDLGLEMPKPPGILSPRELVVQKILQSAKKSDPGTAARIRNLIGLPDTLESAPPTYGDAVSSPTGQQMQSDVSDAFLNSLK